MPPTIEKRIQEVERQVKELSENKISAIMSHNADVNILRAVNRALLSGTLKVGPAGGTSEDICALIALSSITKGFLFSRMTTAQRDLIVNPIEGLVIYNITTDRLNVYNGTSWIEIQDTLGVPSFLAMTRDLTTASGAVATAHGKGRTPSFVLAFVISVAGSGMELTSIGVYDGTTKRCLYYSNNGGVLQANTDSNFSIAVVPLGGTDAQTGAITFDATNVTITWTKLGSPTGNAYVLLVVF